MLLRMTGLAVSAVGTGPLDWFTLQNCLIFSLDEQDFLMLTGAIIQNLGKNCQMIITENPFRQE